MTTYYDAPQQNDDFKCSHRLNLPVQSVHRTTKNTGFKTESTCQKTAEKHQQREKLLGGTKG
jgi:hypothetical protein